jgi:DNA-binding CsgD family transcriptional regulator
MNQASLINLHKLKIFSKAVHALYQASGEDDFPSRTVHILEKFFGTDIVAYNNFPPENQSVRVFSNVDFDPGGKLTPVFIALFPEHPLSHCVLKDKYLDGLRTTDAMSLPVYKKTAIYNEFYKKIGGDFQMAVVFPGQKGHTIAYALNQNLRNFSDEELFFLRLFFPHLQHAHDLDHARRVSAVSCNILGAALSAKGLGVMGFDDGHRVCSVNAEAEAAIWQFFRCRPQVGSQMPAALRNSVRQLENRVRGKEIPTPPRTFVQSAKDGSQTTLRLWLDPEHRRHYLILEPEQAALVPGDLTVLDLTIRQTEIVHWILQGKTNWETSVILGISNRTVEKHVENIFSKLGVANRSGLQKQVLELVSRP